MDGMKKDGQLSLAVYPCLTGRATPSQTLPHLALPRHVDAF